MILLIYAMIMNIYACDEIKMTCDIICKTDGDEAGFMINNKCYCSNQRDLSKIIVKVPKNGKVVIDKNRRYDE